MAERMWYLNTTEADVDISLVALLSFLVLFCVKDEHNIIILIMHVGCPTCRSTTCTCRRDLYLSRNGRPTGCDTCTCSLESNGRAEAQKALRAMDGCNRVLWMYLITTGLDSKRKNDMRLSTGSPPGHPWQGVHHLHVAENIFLKRPFFRIRAIAAMNKFSSSEANKRHRPSLLVDGLRVSHIPVSYTHLTLPTILRV